MVTQKQEQFKVSSSSGDYDVVISNNEELLISNLNECKFFIADSFFKESFIFENIDKNNIFFVDKWIFTIKIFYFKKKLLFFNLFN